jgi:hypothetical protein
MVVFQDCSRVTSISGQSLPILAPLPTIDVLWSDLHMVHEDRSLMNYDSFYWTFRTARTQKILAGSGDPSSLLRKTSFKRRLKILAANKRQPGSNRFFRWISTDEG